MAHVKFFSHLRRALDTKETEVQARDVGELIESLIALYGDRFRDKLPACKVYVNGTHVGHGKGRRTKLSAGDEVVFMPPVAGG